MICNKCNHAMCASACITAGELELASKPQPKVEETEKSDEMRGQIRFLVAENKRLSGVNKGLMHTVEHLASSLDSITHVQEAKRASTNIKSTGKEFAKENKKTRADPLGFETS